MRAQRLAKAWLARKQYGRALGASMALQAAGASYNAKKWLKEDKAKVAYIQACIRALLERAKYLRLRNAAILMQAAERCLLCSSSVQTRRNRRHHRSREQEVVGGWGRKSKLK